MAFENWMKNINARLFSDYGCTIGDLPDEPFRDYYDEGLTPKNVVEIMKDRNIELEMFFN